MRRIQKLAITAFSVSKPGLNCVLLKSQIGLDYFLPGQSLEFINARGEHCPAHNCSVHCFLCFQMKVTLWRTGTGDAPEPNLSLGPRTLTSSAMHSACQPKIVLHPCQVLLLRDYLLCKIPWQSSWYHYLVGMELPALIGFFLAREFNSTCKNLHFDFAYSNQNLLPMQWNRTSCNRYETCQSSEQEAELMIWPLQGPVEAYLFSWKPFELSDLTPRKGNAWSVWKSLQLILSLSLPF